MAFWIFKIAEQDLYPDQPGKKYVYDNTHSIRVQKGDIFLYLDKTKGYSFTATGTVNSLSERKPTLKEANRTRNVRVVYTAHLNDVVWFSKPLSVSTKRREGKRNRAQLGITDVNLLGWSQSIPLLGETMYQSILDLANLCNLLPSASKNDFSVPDNWSITKSRPAMNGFNKPVMRRSDSKCVVCGSRLAGLVEAAHLSPYATDVKNRANPANGICLCKYCHRALDLRHIAITPDGDLLYDAEIDDPVALFHFKQLQAKERRAMLENVNFSFLRLTVKWHKEYLSNKVKV